MSAILDSVLDPQRMADVRAWDATLCHVSAEEKAALLVSQEKPTVHEEIAACINAVIRLVASHQGNFDAGLLHTLDHLSDAAITWRATCAASEEEHAAFEAAHFDDMCRKDRGL